MAQLRHEYDKFVQRETAIIVVGPESRRSFQEYWSKHQLPFIGLSDPEHRVLKLYGQEVNLFKLGRMPAQVIVDKQGKVRFAHYGHAMSDIPRNAEILALLEGLNSQREDDGIGADKKPS